MSKQTYLIYKNGNIINKNKNMSKDTFKRSYMHPTRRKLADMVLTGEYDSDTQVGWSPDVKIRKVGDKWEDKHHKYEKKDGYIVKTSKNTEALQEIRDYLSEKSKCKNPECKTIKLTKSDKTLIKKTGHCITCLATIESDIKANDLWTEYQNYKIWTRMIVHGKAKLEQINQAISELKQEYTYINEDGTSEKWIMPTPVDEVKANMNKMYKNGTSEIEELEQKRDEAYNIIKSKNYEHVL